MKSLLFSLAFLLSVAGFGQVALSGKVVAADTGLGLEGVHVALSDRYFATTDVHGIFKIANVDPGSQTLELHYVGYEPIITPIEVGDTNELVAFRMYPGVIQLDDIVIRSNADVAAGTLSAVDIRLRPIRSSQDILRMVPGLFIAQHAGGGKAEQIFLRGFDVDHGTDVHIEVDGLPVNMVSHAHGQGYSDLHFIIPELVASVDFDKGPFGASKGDFATAGFVNFRTRKTIDRNMIKLEVGSFGTVRAVTAVA